MKNNTIIFSFVLLFFLTGCNKEVSVDDLTADNYREILKLTISYSLDNYDTGISEVAFPLPANSKALDIISFDPPWSFEKTEDKENDFYTASITNNILTKQMYYKVTFNGKALTGGSFIGIPTFKYKLNLESLQKKGYTYKETVYKSGKDILVKKFGDSFFVIVQLEEFDDLVGGLMIFSEYEAK